MKILSQDRRILGFCLSGLTLAIILFRVLPTPVQEVIAIVGLAAIVLVASFVVAFAKMVQESGKSPP